MIIVFDIECVVQSQRILNDYTGVNVYLNSPVHYRFEP